MAEPRTAEKIDPVLDGRDAQRVMGEFLNAAKRIGQTMRESGLLETAGSSSPAHSMHELSVAHSLVLTVSEALEGSAPCRVTRVHLRVGVLAGVAAEAIVFCYDLVTRGTALEGSVLEVRALPLVIHCEVCQRDVELPDETRFRCPTCGTASADIRQGKELEVESVEVEDETDLNDGATP